MSEYGRPPREEKASRGWQIALGCGAGCLVLLVGAAIGCNLLWQHLRARKEVPKEVSVLTGGEVLYASLYVNAQDPGMAALRAHLMEALQRMRDEASPGRRGGSFTGLPGDAELLPLRLELRAYPRAPGEPRAWVGEVDLSGGFNLLATAFRFVGRKERQAVGHASIYHFIDKGQGKDAWIGISGNRVLFAKRKELLVPLVDGSHPTRAVAPPAAVHDLADATRLAAEDARGWTVGGEDLGAPWLRSGAGSADLVDDERIAFRIALAVPATEDRRAIERIVAAWVRNRVPEGLEVNLNDPEWIGPGTVRYTGEVTGLSAALDDWFETHMNAHSKR
ncbi:MAG TPA: hypothetical protein VFV75_15295 [Candidatus Polarisedimenticolaceae bacterium]|nr:hypothetical protein [Candidatus Polarisedimenticolaceae bacterium]